MDLLEIAKRVASKSDIEIIVEKEVYNSEYSGSNDRLIGKMGEILFTENDEGIQRLWEFYGEMKLIGHELV